MAKNAKINAGLIGKFMQAAIDERFEVTKLGKT